MEELLRQTPSVSLTDKRISILGAGGTKVFVDGKEVRLTGEQLINYLRNLPSQNIKKVEVLPMADAASDTNDKRSIVYIHLKHRVWLFQVPFPRPERAATAARQR